MQTERGIYYNLKESTYILDYNGYRLYFSSEFYKNKFELEVESFINYETLKLENKFKCRLFLRSMLIISFYKKVEKRGFYVLVNCGMDNDYVELDKDYVFRF